MGPVELIAFLILFPACVAALLLFVKADNIRQAIVYVSAAVIAVASVYIAVTGFGKP